MYLYVRGEILEKCIYYKITEQYNLRKCECAPKLQLKFFYSTVYFVTFCSGCKKILRKHFKGALKLNEVT